MDTVDLNSTLAFHFDNIQALNEALKRVYTNTDSDQTVFFEVKRNRLIRPNQDYLSAFLSKYEHLPNIADIGTIFIKDVYVASHITFDGTIKKVTNKEYELNDKTASWQKYIYTNRDETMQIGSSIDVKGIRFNR